MSHNTKAKKGKGYEENKAEKEGDKGKTRSLNELRRQTSSQIGEVFQVGQTPEQRP